jgi:uncharacterized protein (TIGR02099 family)
MLDERKHLIEGFVQNEYNIDISIGSVAATWSASGPSLRFNDVKVRQTEQSPVSFEVEDVYLSIEFWSSLFSAKLQSKNVTLSDLNVTLDLTQIEASPGSNFPILTALESVFLEQLTNFSIRNSDITLITEANQKMIRVRQLSWLNRDNRHQGLGELALQGFASNTAIFVLDLTGDVDSYDGVLYAKGADLDVSPWVNEFASIESTLLRSKGNFTVWADIQEGRFSSVRGVIENSEFDWETADDSVLNTRVSAQFKALPNNEEWLFSIADVTLDSGTSESISQWSGTYSAQAGLYFTNTNTVMLGEATPFVSIFNHQLATLFDDANFNATIEQLHVKADASGLHILTQKNELSWDAYQTSPGLDKLWVDVFWSHNAGKIRLYSEDAAVETAALFDRNLTLDRLDIPVFITSQANGASFISKDGILEIDDVTLFPRVSYNTYDDNLSIIVGIEQLALSKVPSLLPNAYMGQNAKQYLSRAFTGAGRVNGAHVLWHGRAQDFPFDDNSGVFQASVDIRDADFMFSDRWPSLSELDIQLLFENKGLKMTANSGQLQDVSLSNLRAQIPELTNNAMLTILADGQSEGEAVARLFTQSTLQNSLGRVLSNDVIVSGPVSTELGLYIPLSNVAGIRAIGEAKLRDSDVRITALGLDFTSANGIVAFDNENLSITGLDAALVDQPVTINLIGQQLPNSYDLDIDIQGEWDIDPLVERYAVNFTDTLSGSAQWMLNVGVSLNAQEYSYTANLSSNLYELDASLPAPFYKPAQQALPFELFASGNNMASNIEITLGKDVTFEGVLPHKERQFSRAHLALGQTDFVGMGVGFSVSANLPSVELEPWINSVKGIVGGISSNTKPILPAPERIFAQTDQLLVLGTRITDVNVTAKRLDRDWQLEVDADQLRGNADISESWLSKGVRINADYLKLNDVDLTASVNAQSEDFDPTTLPLINLVCEVCEVSDVKLGRVVLEAEPNDDGLEIKRLQIEAENGDINASGQWYKRHQDHFTFIAGDVESNDFGRLLSNLGFESGIKDSQAELDFALTWQQSPMEFSLEQLDGQINWELSDGYLAEVSDKGSRIFTLLSLNSLVRKLSLDFRDVFAKGFFYDEMGGSVQITDGKADTRDTSIDGAAGEIEIYGYTDLVSQELNYNISFTPNVTGNLPVLVYFFTVSPPSALAALAIDQVLTSAKVISNVNYSVSGTLDDPVLIETGRQSTDVALPTRRDAMQDEQRPLFLPPTEEDLLPIEREDG